MKKNSVKIIVFIIIFGTTSFSQLARNSWNFGFGGTYPRFMGITPPSHTGRDNYGAFLFLQRNFSEHVGLRLQPNFNHIESEYNINSQKEFQKLNLFAANLDLIYYLVPCEPISPYLTMGFGGMIFNSKNSPDKQYDDTFSAYQFNFGAGAEWKLNDTWKILTEFSYHSASTNEIDGRDDVITKGLFGTTSDAYAKLDLGIVYYFSKGEPSHICDIYEGIKPVVTAPEKIDYDKIENMIKENLPKETPNVGITAPEPPKKTNWVLIGVNFDFGSAKLKKESYPVLLYALQILENNHDMKVEIQGYTDNIGSEKVNLNLSEKRAETVKQFLISKGIVANRLSTKGFGEINPVVDNNSPENRDLNRRIEFRILEQ